MNTTLKRTLSGLIFVALTVGGFLLSPYTFAAVMVVVMVCSTHEFYSMCVGDRFTAEKICVHAAQVLAFAGLFFYFNDASAAGLKAAFASPLLVFVAYSLMLRDCGREHLFNTELFFPLVYVLVPVCSTLPLCYCVTGKFEPWVLVSVFLLAWSNDIFAYVFGMLFGQKKGSRKLAPAISPKKSWAGVIGGTVFCFITAALVCFLFGFRFFRFQHWMVLAGIASTFGVAGDLFESLIKRHASVKDAGNVIPGHGGFLDRFDDIFFIVPIITIYLYLVSVI